MARKLIVFFCLMLAVTVWGFAAEPVPVKVMTQNMDAGTDLGFAIAELLGFLPPGVGVELTYEEILASDIPGRTTLLASSVADKKPDLLCLQEATLWRTGESVNTATTVLYDQLQLLLADLAAAGVSYDIAAVETLADQALPKASGGTLRITDRNALLIRADLLPPELHLSDVHSDTFDAVYSIGGLHAPAGWISAIVHTGNRHFRLVTTHLTGPVPGDPTSVAVQVAQADQLIHELRNSAVPVVIAGDFNSDAIQGTAGPGPDNTATAAMIQAAGYLDTWTGGPGPTWPLYLEDHFPPPPFIAPSTPFERIDLIFSQGLNPVSVEHVVAPGLVPTGFGSDHLGGIAVFQF
ncbi:MAG TPA: endonuclease/exonuclease/phosphatase family protein [Bryobacteraceae bacterium]|jgi:endonuclease/exonuclease/phosphatase family metal-dependent hydrolase|nr:endonuclease/exonuclease/phosphatase family protein [Bryobacteraceae bacterium]